MSTLEDLFTDGAPAHLLDSLTEVLLRDPVKVDGCIYSRSSLVDLGWKHPITQEPLGNGDIVASDEYTAEVERYIGERLREKIGPLLLDSLDARRENDVDTLLELIKAFERRLNMPCVRSSCETLASRLDSLLEYELEDVFLKSKASLFPEECLMTFCRQHCLSHVVRTLDRFEAEQFALSNNTAEVVGGDFANLDSFSPERGTHLGPATASSTVEPRHPPYGGHKSGSHISTMGESYNSSSSYSAPRPLTSVAASAHVPQSPYRAAEFAAESRRQYQEAPPLNPTILRLTGMPLDVDTKLVTTPVQKYRHDLESITVSRHTATTSIVTMQYSNYDSACAAMGLLLGLTFDGLRPGLNLESKPVSPVAQQIPRLSTTRGVDHSHMDSGMQATAQPLAMRQAPPVAGAPARTHPPQAASSHRQILNINRWMFSVWMGNLPRPVSRTYQTDLISAVAPFKKNVLGVHVHATAKGKYLFVDFDSESMARRVASALRGRRLGNRDASSKFSKKRKVFKAGSAHKEPLNLVTMFVTNIANEQLAIEFLAEQCPLSHAIDIPMPFKHMAFFQFTSKAHAEQTVATIRELQDQHLSPEIDAIALVVNSDTQDLIASDRLSDVYDMVQQWDSIQMSSGQYTQSLQQQLQLQQQQQPPQQQQQQSPRYSARSVTTTADPTLEWIGDDVDVPYGASSNEAPNAWSVPPKSTQKAPSTTPKPSIKSPSSVESDEVYQSDGEEFFELLDNDASATTSSSAVAFSGGSDGMSGAPYNVQAPATSLLLSTTTSVATTTTAKSYGQSLQSTSLAKQGSNVCIEGRARLEDRPEAIFAPRFRNYKCFVQLSASQLGYLTKFFHLHRSRDIANAFNRLQTKHGSVLQFDKDARRYFFYSADEQATVNAAHEMAMLSVLHECNIHLRAHLCLQEYLEEYIIPDLGRAHQIYAKSRLAKNTGCKTCDVIAASPDPAMEQRFPSIKWDNHEWHITLSVCGDVSQVAKIEKQFTNYSPLNLSFGFSPTQYAAFKEAVHIDHDSMTGFITSMEEKYDLVVFNRSNAFFAISGLVRDDVINCTTELFGLGRQRSG